MPERKNMASKLFVGGLPFETKEDDLKSLFEEFGEVESAVIINDKFSGRSKGFGFVEFGTEEEAKRLGQIQADCMLETGKELGFKIPTPGSYDVGKNWAETH